MNVGQWKQLMGNEYTSRLVMSDLPDNAALDRSEAVAVAEALDIKSQNLKGWQLVTAIAQKGGWKDAFGPILGIKYTTANPDDESVIFGSYRFVFGENEIRQITNNGVIFILDAKTTEVLGVDFRPRLYDRHVHMVN